MAQTVCRILFALALWAPLSALAAESDIAQARDRAGQALSVWNGLTENPRCTKAYDTCTNFCDTNFDNCSRNRSSDVVDRRCRKPYQGCTAQCDRNEKFCSK